MIVNIDSYNEKCECLIERDGRIGCLNCKYALQGERWDYSKIGGEWKTKLEGHICVGLASEGLAVQMVGVEKNYAICEMYTPKEVRDETD